MYMEGEAVLSDVNLPFGQAGSWAFPASIPHEVNDYDIRNARAKYVLPQ